MDPAATHKVIHRKTMKRFDALGDVRFVTFSCEQRLALFNNDDIKQAFVDVLARARERECLHLHAWVVMPEHVHLLVSMDDGPRRLAHVLHGMKAGFAREVIGRWRELDAPILARITASSGHVRFWLPGGGYDRNICSQHEFNEKFNYIHWNPVKRGLVSSPEEWVWSSARAHAGFAGAMLAADGER